MNSLIRIIFSLLASAVALTATAKDEALSLVPANAVNVGMVRLSDMRTSPLSSLLFQHIDSISTDGDAEAFLVDAGLQPLQDVDRLVVATSPRTSLGSEPDILVIAEGRFQPDRLVTALVARGGVQKSGYVILPGSNRNGADAAGAVAFVSRSLAIAGNERSVLNALAARASGGTGFESRGVLAFDLARIDPNATAWTLVDVPRAARLARGGAIVTGTSQAAATVQAALKSVSTVAVWATDTGDSLKLGATGLSNDEETLHLLEDSLRGALAAMRVVVKDKSPEMVSVLRRFAIRRSSEAITIEGSIPATTLRELMARTFAEARK